MAYSLVNDEHLGSRLENMNNCIVSIIIPTKNRHNQLISTLLAHSKISSLADIQIIISDNSADRIEYSYLDMLHKTFVNLKYIHDPAQKDIMANFSSGLAHADGEFVMFIGDDDFFLPSIVNAARYAKENNINCIIYEPDRYYWKSCKFVEKKINYGPETLVKSKPSVARKIDVSEQLKRSSQNGFLTIELLPRAYHGLINKRILLNESDANGHLYGGSPDISMAVNLALCNVSTFVWGEPLSIYGASSGSGGGMTTSKTHILKLSDANFLSKDFISNWDSNIPSYWSEYTVFPASALYMHKVKECVPADFNASAVYASILVNETIMWREALLKSKKAYNQQKITFIISFSKSLARKIAGRLWRKLINTVQINKISGKDYIHNVAPDQVLVNYLGTSF
jgi:glycosyltransferase involved in cell wall biosynthesis